MQFKFEKTLVIVLVYCQLYLASCDVINKDTKQKHLKLSDKMKPYTIEGKWKLKKSHWLNIEINESSSFILGVDIAEMKIYGHDGCNGIYGDLVIFENDQLEIDRIGGTMKYCRGLKGADNNFRKSLKKAKTFKINGLNLFLFDKNENVLLEFERRVD